MGERIKKFIKHNDGTGTFNLTVSFNKEAVNYSERQNINLEEIKTYLEETFFKTVSLLLERATFGQHNLNISFDGEGTDILITKYTTNAFGSRLWNMGFVAFALHHIYSPGLMLHELGHYLYGLKDEIYASCRSKRIYPQPITKASIMEFTFGGTSGFRRRINIEDGKDESRGYNVLGGLEAFWSDYKGGEGIKDGTQEFKYRAGEVVTDFCNDYTGDLQHNKRSKSVQNKTYKNRFGSGRSCWSVMLDDMIGGEDRSAVFKYGLKDPFAKANIGFKQKFEIERNIENEIENTIGIDLHPSIVGKMQDLEKNRLV